MNGLFWFRYDLRLHDNPALLNLARQCEQLVCVYVVDTRASMSAFRWQFIRESLADLQQHLATLGQTLVIRVGQPDAIISALIQTHDIQIAGTTPVPATYEQRQLTDVKQTCPQCQWMETESFTLFDAKQLPFNVNKLPDSFTPFRKQVEQIAVAQPLQRPQRLPAPLPSASDPLPEFSTPEPHPNTLPFSGGETAGLAQVRYYLHDTRQVSRYKLTRNGLDGWDFSSKLSPWLAQGCVSPRQIVAELQDYEAQYGANDSTYWMYFELLWREYFQWLHYRYGNRLYLLRGIRNQDPLLSKNPKALTGWCEGKTAAPFVNAFMHQLCNTGWMSNRGRQIVASYLINQLGVDWRDGAAWFEAQLIDYDPASNWGNWQYLAGVGTDPRGRREFNIGKQQREYDPAGVFVGKYLHRHVQRTS